MNNLFYGYGQTATAGVEAVMASTPAHVSGQKYRRNLEFLSRAYGIAPRKLELVLKRKARLKHSKAHFQSELS